MMVRLSLFASFFLLAFSPFLASSAHAEQTVTPRLFSPKRTGDCYWFRDTRTSANSTIVTQSGTIISHDKSQTKTVFEANVTVISNNALGKSTEERFDVVKFTLSKDEAAPVEMLAPGARFYCKSENGKKVFTDTEGQKLSKELAGPLSQIIALRDNSITDEDIFGPGQPVSAGDSWPINADLAAEDFNFDMTLQCDAKYLKGTVTLVDTPTLDGVACNHFLGQMEVSRIKMPSQKTLRLLKGDLTFSSEIWMPQEGPCFPVRQHTQMKIVFIGDPADQNAFAPKRMMATSTIDAIVESKPLPRDESVTQLDRTLGIRR